MQTDELDRIIQDLQDHKNDWMALPLARKIDLLVQIRQRLIGLSRAWVDTSLKNKGMTPGAPEEGEEWTLGPWTLAVALNGYIDSLSAIAAGGLPKPSQVHTRPNGQVAAQVFPNTIFDKILLSGVHVDIWMQPGVTEANLPENTGGMYCEKNVQGQVALVLGAGNIATISARDVLYQLFVLGHVVALKMSPVISYMGPVFEDLFAPLIQAGYVHFIYGDGEIGRYLVHHPGVELVHMTGSNQTFETIVFGPGEAGQERKRRNEPLLNKPITAELGGVCPVIILPGKWSRTDLRHQAANVVTMKLHNSGFNCVASQVLVLPQEWDQREEFLEEVRRLMRDLPPRTPYYPGTAERQRAAIAAHPEAEQFDQEVPRTLITGLDPNAPNESCFLKEFFGPVYAETSLPGRDAAEFLTNAVRFCNDKLFGTLGATILAHPRTIRQLGTAFEAALTDLHYGAIGVNVWSAAAFLLVQSTWGGFPGHTFQDVQSGIGYVGNSFLFNKPERTVIYGPFFPFPRTWLHGEAAFLPKPPWFLTNKTAHITTRGVAQITMDPHFRYLPAILISALRG